MDISESPQWRSNKMKLSDELFDRALAAEEAGQIHAAIALYWESVGSYPGNSRSWLNLGHIMQSFPPAQTGVKKEEALNFAERYYRQAIAVSPDYSLGYFNLGALLDEIGKDDEAVEVYLKGLEVNPRHSNIHYNLAVLYDQIGEMSLAIKHYEQYLETLTGAEATWTDIAKRRLKTLRDRVNLFKLASEQDGGM